MARPKGCTCGTPKPCQLHADRATAEGSEPGGAMPENGGAPELLFPGVESDKTGGRRKRDMPPKPRQRQRKPVAPDAPDDAALVDMLGQLLTMPAIPAAMILDCDYCRDHFITEGPRTARELVALSITNPALRSALESLHSGFTKLTIAGVLAGYLAKPLLHHAAPEPVLAAAGPVLKVPPRPEKPKHSHDHAADPHTEDEHPPGPGGSAPSDQYAGAALA